jgi:hypothetical protein
MANTFKNYVASDVGTAPNTVYTVPAATTSVMIGCNIANKTTAAIYVDVQLGSTYLVKGAPIPSGSALSVLDGKIIIETGETFVVTSDADTSADVVLSVLEQT